MTKKDFEAIAAILAAQSGYDCCSYQIEDIARAVADYCAENYPRFDDNRFLHACGLEGQ
jgi:hypothetical protein